MLNATIAEKDFCATSTQKNKRKGFFLALNAAKRNAYRLNIPKSCNLRPMSKINRKTPVEDPITLQEVKAIAYVLSKCHGNVKQAAYVLGMKPATLEILILKHKDLQRVMKYWR